MPNTEPSVVAARVEGEEPRLAEIRAIVAKYDAEVSPTVSDLAFLLDRLRTVERERDEARKDVSALRAQVAGLRESAVEFDDPRIGYVTIQVDRATWTALRVTPTENGHER